MLHLLLRISFWLLVALCFAVQGRFIKFPLDFVPWIALTASWILVINERRKVFIYEMKFVREEIAKRTS